MVDAYFLEDEISDSQLRMLFACCHPAIPSRIAGSHVPERFSAA
jgi:predicted RNA polymerase sigma factor